MKWKDGEIRLLYTFNPKKSRISDNNSGGMVSAWSISSARRGGQNSILIEGIDESQTPM